MSVDRSRVVSATHQPCQPLILIGLMTICDQQSRIDQPAKSFIMRNQINMETFKLNLHSMTSFRACFAAVLALLFCSLAHGADVTWTGGNGAWQTGSNWSSGSIPTSDDLALISSGTVGISNSTGTAPNILGFRQTGGTLNITGGTVEAGQVRQFSGFDGTVNQSGGFTSYNMARIGASANSNGSYTVTGGEFNIARAIGNVSLSLGGVSSGTGSMTISGGSFAARQSVRLGGDSSSVGTGTFAVNGSQATGISIGSSGVDGVWQQSAGSSLVVRFDIGGSTPIYLIDNGGSGTSATFANGAILDVDHLAGSNAGAGTWTVMEVENGTMVDNGLAFAPSVDTSVWSFEIDNSGANGKLVVTAAGVPFGFDLIVGDTEEQMMRYGMDYERLWYWTGGLNDSERDLVAKWSAIDTRIDFIRVAINSDYELEEGTYKPSAYTNKILPLMEEMRDANPDIKFFASPRPLNEAVSGAAWQPYPRWVTGNTAGSSSFDFDWQKCAEYLERYLVLMDDNGFKISFMDLTNEWQSNSNNAAGASSRINQNDYVAITNYLKTSTVLSDKNINIPLFIGPSSWNYSQGGSWIRNLNNADKRAAVDIAASHNTNKTGTAQDFGDDVRARFGDDTEIWNTEVHGWKSTSSANETTTFAFYLEQIRAGFSGLTGWLAIGTTNQGHAYILNPNGRPVRNVKYFIFKKLSETSNYGHNMEIIEEPSQLVNDDDEDVSELPHTAALIKGNLMTVWVINTETSAVPLKITPFGRVISESTVKRTRWTDPSDVEGFVSQELVYSNAFVASAIPAQSVCCFEILLDPKEDSYVVIQAEDDDAQSGLQDEGPTADDGTPNVGFIENGDWARYDDIALFSDTTMRFRVARPSGRDDGWVEVYLGSPGASTASILAGTPVGKVAVPETGNWQVYQTIQASLENAEGDYDVVLQFDEVGSTNGDSLFNFNWFSVVTPEPQFVLGDANGDGFVNNFDISAFATALFNRSLYVMQYPDIDPDVVLDMNDDGEFSNFDIAAFSAALGF